LFFKYHVNMYLFICKSKGKHLVINSSYHTCILFIFNPLPYITYLSWFATSYGCPSIMVSMWSYHWQSTYSFALMPLWEWAYNNPWYISKYYHSCYFGEWLTYLEGGFPYFPLPHLTMTGYPYHHKWFSDFDGHCHYWFDSNRHGATNVNDEITCNNVDCLGKDTIICWVNNRRWLHSPCYWDVWVSSFLFWFIFYYLCIDHYRTSSTVFFSPFNACLLLSITHVHNLAMCISHNDSSTCCTWLGFFVSSTHHS